MIIRRGFCSAATTRPWLFVGLGNPGDKFKGTRHNVGFEMIDAFAEAQGIEMDTLNCKAIFGQGFVDDAPVLLAKPQTYMNLSGESTGPLAAYYKLPLNRVIVFHDDLNLPCGVLRFQDKGGHGNHNGYEWRILCTLPEDIVHKLTLNFLSSLLIDSQNASLLHKKSFNIYYFLLNIWFSTQVVEKEGIKWAK